MYYFDFFFLKFFLFKRCGGTIVQFSRVPSACKPAMKKKPVPLLLEREESILTSSGISEMEILLHPTELLKALSFYFHLHSLRHFSSAHPVILSESSLAQFASSQCGDLSYEKFSIHKTSQAFTLTQLSGKQVFFHRISVHPDELKQLTADLISLRGTNHPHIINLVDVFIDSNQLVLGFEQMDISVTDILEQYEHLSLSESDIAYICSGILKALAFMHNRGKKHRKLQTDKVYISSEGRVKLYCLLLLSHFCPYSSSYFLSISFRYDIDILHPPKRYLRVLTPYWMSPEEILGANPPPLRSDIWSLGIAIREMAEGNLIS